MAALRCHWSLLSKILALDGLHAVALPHSLASSVPTWQVPQWEGALISLHTWWMGKRDKRTRKGKIFKGSFGKARPWQPEAPWELLQPQKTWFEPLNIPERPPHIVMPLPQPLHEELEDDEEYEEVDLEGGQLEDGELEGEDEETEMEGYEEDELEHGELQGEQEFAESDADVRASDNQQDHPGLEPKTAAGWVPETAAAQPDIAANFDAAVPSPQPTAESSAAQFAES